MAGFATIDVRELGLGHSSLACHHESITCHHESIDSLQKGLTHHHKNFVNFDAPGAGASNNHDVCVCFIVLVSISMLNVIVDRLPCCAPGVVVNMGKS